MSIKSVQKISTFFVSFMVLSIALCGCGTTKDQPQSPAPTTSVSEPATSPKIPVDSAVARGLSLYDTQCKVCHGTNGSGGSGPRLIGKTPSASYIKSNMPRNKPGSLSSEQVSDLVAFITSLK